MAPFISSRRVRSALYLVVALALLDCTAKERNLGELASVETGGTNGGDGTGEGGSTEVSNGGTAGRSQGSTSRGGTSNRGGSQNGGTSNGGTPSSVTTSAPLGGTTSSGGMTSVTGGSSASGGTYTGGTSTGFVTAVGGTLGSGGVTSSGGVTNSTGTIGIGGTVTTGGTAATGGTTSVVGPSVVVLSGPAEGSNSSLTTVTFTFGSTPNGATKYECSFDAAAFTDCTSSILLSNLVAGEHKLIVRAYNAANIVGPLLTRVWSVVALATTIKTLRGGTVPVNTLATISTGVRLSGMYSTSKGQLIFVQEADMKYAYSVDKASDLAGDPILNSGILTRPAAIVSLTRAPGYIVWVTGVFTNNQNNAELIRATYDWKSAGTPYTVPNIRTSDALGEGLEGVRVNVAGGIPSANCANPGIPCQNSSNGNSLLCIEACSSASCSPITWTQLQGTAASYRYGYWGGHLLQNGGYYVLGVVDSFDQNDACL